MMPKEMRSQVSVPPELEIKDPSLDLKPDSQMLLWTETKIKEQNHIKVLKN